MEKAPTLGQLAPNKIANSGFWGGQDSLPVEAKGGKTKEGQNREKNQVLFLSLRVKILDDHNRLCHGNGTVLLRVTTCNIINLHRQGAMRER